MIFLYEEYPYDFDINSIDNLDDPDYLEENFLMSGNPRIDEFIRNDNRLKWIPYEQLTNIEYIACGGFGVVSKAKWESRKVVLKSLNNSKDITTDILREITYHQQFDHVHVPKLLKTLIIKCWDDNPTIRPEALDILFHFRNWYFDSDPEFRLQYQQIKVAEESLTSNNLAYQMHPQAIYTSRLLNLNSKDNDFYVPENLGELNINDNDKSS
ncbi:serine/threonine protein kinase [Gigaspora margarita]|uniref:Serine/threonine protein kinase n=1 Tax=Gigaspora margarita TaxID=4874 RepID=A0A8H3XEU3_GIGMA|nr:serine/threonine protein kinase [Gigaspora margarita]